MPGEGPVVKGKVSGEQGDGIMPGGNLRVKQSISDSGRLKQKFEVKEVLSRVTVNSVTKNQILFEGSNSKVSAVSVPTNILFS